ncbi:hypothetical protein UlMin_023252 [Ulmus minor]
MDSSNTNKDNVDLESSDDEISIAEDYVADGKYGTGNMRKHIKVCPKNNSRDVGQMLLGGSSGSGSLGVLSNKFDPDKLRELIVYAIIMHDLPFQFVEYEGVRSILQYLRPEVQLVSRNTIKSDCMKIHQKEKARVKSLLHAAPGRISITSDLWSSLISDGYILLLEWDIQGKIFGITLDNASANDVSVEELRVDLNSKGLLVCRGNFFHLRCCVHILNLIVQDGLKEIESSIEKIRESVKYVKGSQVRRQKFLECVRLISMGGKRGLRQDVATRWNSTYLMLDSALFYRCVFQHLALVDSNYKKCPSSEEWERVEKVHKFLKVFYEATLTFSGTKYPTSSLYFPVVIYCYQILKDALDGEDDYMSSMATKMWVKFQKYWAAFSDTLAIACIFDPRYKLEFIDFVYNKIYGLESLELFTLHEKINDLYSEYATKIGGTEFDDVSSESAPPTKSQLQLYFEDQRLSRFDTVDVLAFWKTNQYRFPIVAAMARDILAVPVSTVASEAAFSVGGRVLDQFRSSLKPDTVEAIICTRDWLFGEKVDDDINELTQDVVQLSLNEKDSGSNIDNSNEGEGSSHAI